jgi:hypothetical protein
MGVAAKDRVSSAGLVNFHNSNAIAKAIGNITVVTNNNRESLQGKLLIRKSVT